MNAILDLEAWRQLILLVPFGVALFIAAFTDIRGRKVFNWLTYPMIIGGLVLRGVALGWPGVGSGLLAAFLMLVIGILIITTGMIRGGDIKLFIGVGAFMGGRGLFEIAFYSVFCGLFIGLTISAFNGFLKQMFIRTWQLIRGYVLMILYRTKNFRPELEPDERSQSPFAVAILAGSILVYTEYTLGWPGLLTWYLAELGYK